MAAQMFLSASILALLCASSSLADDANVNPVCQPETEKSAVNSSPDRHLLTVHVAELSQLTSFASAVSHAADAGMSIDCRYKQFDTDGKGSYKTDSADSLALQLPVGYLKLAGQSESWPLLFLPDGAVTGERLLERLTEQPALVQDMNDSDFEGLTQAATGSTTGHWLAVFLSPKDPQLAGKSRLLRGLAQALRPSRINVARLLLDEASHETADRFGISSSSSSPSSTSGGESAVLLRSGGFYRLPHRLADWHLVAAFATRGFANHRREAVPAPPSPFDHAVDASLAFLMSFNSVWGVSPVYVALCAGASVVLAVLACLCLCARKGLEKVAKID